MTASDGVAWSFWCLGLGYSFSEMILIYIDVYVELNGID